MQSKLHLFFILSQQCTVGLLLHQDDPTLGSVVNHAKFSDHLISFIYNSVVAHVSGSVEKEQSGIDRIPGTEEVPCVVCNKIM